VEPAAGRERRFHHRLNLPTPRGESGEEPPQIVLRETGGEIGDPVPVGVAACGTLPADRRDPVDLAGSGRNKRHRGEVDGFVREGVSTA
jgi:hypothetical protein